MGPRCLPRTTAAAVTAALVAGRAEAHAAEQGFVLLLPTDLYIAGGVASVALTVLALMLVPADALRRVFRPLARGRRVPVALRTATSLAAALFLLALIWAGFRGATDPLRNPLPLTVWTLWWIGFVSLQGLLGDLWRGLNPLLGPLRLWTRATGWRAPLRFPRRVGRAPGLLLFAALILFLLADPTPTDPRRLAWIVALYWLFSLAMLMAFGARWLVTGEVVTMLMRTYARTAPIGRGIGLPGWQILARPAPSLGGALLILMLLGSGSFDGLNETFWWFATIGVNPLAFPGRSAVVQETVLGLLAFNAGLILAFALAVWLGDWLAGGGVGLRRAFTRLAPSILPIALGYHVGHYLPSFLVDVQYAVAAATDPLGRGDDLLGLGTFYVTTGFFNTQATVRAIWLAQAGAVVAGHVIAILLAHGLALRLYGDAARATRSQIPLAAFMVVYTFFGLWLLASPRGA